MRGPRRPAFSGRHSASFPAVSGVSQIWSPCLWSLSRCAPAESTQLRLEHYHVTQLANDGFSPTSPVSVRRYASLRLSGEYADSSPKLALPR